ncbi:MAG: exopolysaccharide biosynthesis protein [Cyanobacteriota bacterium]|nr:exopolysaccharide biosynthesis protein [Cyanobacteriota bacterium]
MAKLSVELERFFFEEKRESKVTLADIMKLARGRIFGFLFVVISLPSALPIPAPGYSIPFGILLFFLAVQLIIGADSPWLPQAWLKRPISVEKVQGFVKAGIPWLKKIELISRSRLTYICNSVPGKIVIGCAIALMAISMMIPIPATNTIPAIGILVTGFGLLDDDGAISLAGLVICAIGGAVSASILIALWFGGSSLLDMLKEWLNN